MITRYQITLAHKLKSFRLHRAEPRLDPGARPHWLLGIRDRMRAVEEDRRLLAGLCQSISGVVGQALPMVEQNLQQVTALATELGLAVAREIVGEAVDQGRIDVSGVVARCLRQMVHVDEQARIRIELHPEDHDLVVGNLEGRAELEGMVAGTDFVANPGLGRGSVEISSQSGRLLYEPMEVLERISNEIRQELSA